MQDARTDYWNRRPAMPLCQGVDLEELAIESAHTLLLHHVPAQPSATAVLVLHGIESHPLWFIGSCDHLASSGYNVYQLQRHGSGNSREDRGHAGSPAQLLADVDAAVEHVLAESGANRLHLAGISWGGKLAACYALNPPRASRLASLTLVTPGIAPRVDLPWRQKLLAAVCAAAAPRHEFDIPLHEPSLFTDNPTWQAYIRDDPYRLHRVTARFLLASRLLDRQLAAARAGALNLPMHLVLAGRDRIIDNARTKQVLARLAGDRLHIHELQGAHTLEFEEDSGQFFRVLASTFSQDC
jgi:acylglycerol lipase